MSSSRGVPRPWKELESASPGRALATSYRGGQGAEGVRRSLLFDTSRSRASGGIVGIIGPNGAGKTTLFRLITGEEKADGGSLVVGETVKLGYVSQSRDALDPKKNVWEEIAEGQESIQIGSRTRNARAYVASFNFRGPDQQKRVGDLSGGERNRVHLAKMLKSGANVLCSTSHRTTSM